MVEWKKVVRQNHVRCFLGFLMEFLKQMAAYHQAKETCDTGTQTSPSTQTFPSEDPLGNCSLLS